ncbi:hypothetical protein PT974_03146 [Cladobotryum mycophilum]|uniref:Bacteriophage T5 Orf172 DNA-binding domain-containing protein n=1 Tax=Cladobotryum mycophilum TaxID=491253 RepID=A0ABR0SRK8_9HYPO
MINSPHPAAWPDKAEELRRMLAIHEGPILTCHGQTTKKADCMVHISRANSTNVEKLLDRVIAQGNLSTARTLLSELSSLVLCRRYHQDQGKTLLSKWEDALAAAEKRQLAAAESTAETDGSNETMEEMETEEEISHVKKEFKVEDEESLGTVHMEDELSDDSKISTTSSTPTADSSVDSESEVDDSESTIIQHEFEPFGAELSIRKINSNVKEKLLSSLQPTESKAAANPGYIYVYTFPSEYRAAEPYLKIGYTSNLTRRMAQWRNACGYEPKVLSEFLAELHIRVERLVHTQLRNRRMREIDCPGCGRSHYEWFDASASKVAAAVALWTDWTRRQPYGEDGKLKEEWVKMLNDVDLDDSNCWEKFVNGGDR